MSTGLLKESDVKMMVDSHVAASAPRAAAAAHPAEDDAEGSRGRSVARTVKKGKELEMQRRAADTSVPRLGGMIRYTRL